MKKPLKYQRSPKSKEGAEYRSQDVLMTLFKLFKNVSEIRHPQTGVKTYGMAQRIMKLNPLARPNLGNK